REDPERWPPETGTTAGVELGTVAVPAQPGDHWLIRAYQPVERPDLAAVGVAGQLEVHPVRHRAADLLRLGGTEKDGKRRGCAGGGGGVVGRVTGLSRPGRSRVVDTGHDQPGAVALDHDVLVVQRFPAQLPYVVEPALGRPAEVLVVAGDVRAGER